MGRWAHSPGFVSFAIPFGFGRPRTPWPTCRCAWRCAGTAGHQACAQHDGAHARVLQAALRLRVLYGAHGVHTGQHVVRNILPARARVREGPSVSVQGLELLVTVLLARNRPPTPAVAAGVSHAELAAELVSLPSGLLAMVCEAIMKLKVRPRPARTCV